MKKRVLAILLCLIMTVSLLPVAAFAADGDELTTGPKDTTYKLMQISGLTAPVAGAAPDTAVTAQITPKGAETPVDVATEIGWVSYETGAPVPMTATDTFKENVVYAIVVSHEMDATSKLAKNFKVKVADVAAEAVSMKDFELILADGNEGIAVYALDEKNNELGIAYIFEKLPCTHAALSEWKSDDTNHWKECTTCGEKLETAAHVDANHDGKCDVCAHEVALVHTFDTAWTSDATHHWHKCTVEGCQEVSEKAEHVDADNDGKCDVCAYVMSKPHVHIAGEDWKNDATNHWHECTVCGDKLDVAAHVDTNNDGKCDVCGYTAEKPHEHTWSDKWTANSKEHWHACSGCTEKKDLGAHVDANKDGKCDTCGYEMAVEIKTHTELNILLDAPKPNTKVLFTAGITPSGEYGNVTVKWNKHPNRLLSLLCPSCGTMTQYSGNGG